MFSLFVKQEDFAGAVHNIITVCEQTRGTEKGGSLPHFFYIKIEGLGELLRLSGQNMTRRVEVIVGGVTPHTPFCVGVSGIHLKNLIAAMPRGMINLDVTQGCMISNDKSQYYLSTVAADAFPATPVVAGPFSPVDLEALLGVFSKISYCTSLKEGAKPYVKSICILPQNIICTDNNRLSYVPNTYLPLVDSSPILLPMENAKCLAAVFKGERLGQVYIEKNAICFRTDRVSVLSRLYVDKVPNFKSVLDQQQTQSHILVPSNNLRSALKRLTSFMMSSDLTKTTPGVFEFSPDKLRITVKANGYEAEEVLDIEKGFSVKLSLNLVYVYQAIKAIPDLAHFGIRGPEMSVSIEDVSKSFINIVMPLKMGGQNG